MLKVYMIHEASVMVRVRPGFCSFTFTNPWQVSSNAQTPLMDAKNQKVLQSHEILQNRSGHVWKTLPQLFPVCEAIQERYRLQHIPQNLFPLQYKLLSHLLNRRDKKEKKIDFATAYHDTDLWLKDCPDTDPTWVGCTTSCGALSCSMTCKATLKVRYLRNIPSSDPRRQDLTTRPYLTVLNDQQRYLEAVPTTLPLLHHFFCCCFASTV